MTFSKLKSEETGLNSERKRFIREKRVKKLKKPILLLLLAELEVTIFHKIGLHFAIKNYIITGSSVIILTDKHKISLDLANIRLVCAQAK